MKRLKIALRPKNCYAQALDNAAWSIEMRKPPFRLTLFLILSMSVTGTEAGPRGSEGANPTGERKPPLKTLYHDIYLEEGVERISFGNAKLKLEFGREGGEWVSFLAEGVPGNLISPGRPPTAVDFQVAGKRMIQNHGASLLRYAVGIDRHRKGVSLRLVLGVCPSPVPGSGNGDEGGNDKKARPRGFEFELTCVYTLSPRSGRLERSARLLRCASGSGPSPRVRRMEGFVFQLPGVCVGDPSECVVDVPGPWFPKTYVAPRTPYETLKDRSIGFHSAPDAGFGLLAISNEKRGTTLASWMDTAGEVNYYPAIRGEGKRISFHFDNRRAYRMPERFAVDSDTQRIEVVPGPLPRALEKYREMVTRTMPLEPDTPDWVREMVLLEILPSYFQGGLKEITEKLPFYREIGFNAIYLMPHWVGGYSPIDVFKVDSSLGTPDDLKEMVRTAHELGMKVLFDMVIHGFNKRSPLPGEHPEYFIHDEQGNIARHPAWRSMSTDWASPAYQQFMVNLVLHDLREYDIDGYRVDAASYKAPNWDPDISYPAYRSATAAPELMRRMLSAMREVKSDAVLLSEVFGPVFYTVCNLVHDNQTEAPQQFIEMIDADKATALDYKRHMADVLSLLPRGANRVYFARNHDTSWFYHFNGYTPRFLALDAIHALCAIPEVFAGDRRHPPNPDDDPVVFDYYRKLLALRKQFPELGRGELLLREVECDNPLVFTALRRLEARVVLVVISLSNKEEEASVTLSPAAPELSLPKPPGQRKKKLELVDAITGETLPVSGSGSDREGESIPLKLKPFQVLVGRL